MTTKQVKSELRKANLSWREFLIWMKHQTISGTPDNPDWYECDVERFIRGRGELRTLD